MVVSTSGINAIEGFGANKFTVRLENIVVLAGGEHEKSARAAPAVLREIVFRRSEHRAVLGANAELATLGENHIFKARGDFLRRAVIQRTVFLFAVTFI